MNGRLAVIGGLLLLAAGLAGLLWWPVDAPRPADTPVPLPRVTEASPSTIDHLSVRHGRDHVRLARIDDHWRLQSPVDAPADPAHLQVLMALAEARARRRMAADSVAPATSGTGDTAVVVSYDDGAPIRIGAPGPGRSTRYVQTPDGLLIVPLAHYDVLHWHWTDWLDRALIAPGRRLTRIVLPHHTLGRDADGQWQVAPGDTAGDRAAAETIAAWQRAEALTVVPADTSRAPLAHVTLDFAQASSVRLDIIEQGPNLILRDPTLGVDYHLAGNRIAPLLALQHPGL